MDAAESNSVRTALAALRQRIRPAAADIITNAIGTADEYCVRVLRYRIAELCDSRRHPDPARTATLHHSGYLRLKSGDYPDVVSDERRQAIAAFQSAARSTQPGLPKKLHWTYLAGELLRCAGETNEAVAWLEDAERLPEPPGTESGGRSLRLWASEQAAKARRGDTNDSPRPRMHGPERDQQIESVRRQLPGMVEALNSGKAPKEWLAEGGAQPETVWLVIDLAELGNTNAVRFLYGWLARLDAVELPDREDKIEYAVRALARQGQCIPDGTIVGTRFHVAQLGAAAKYAVRGGPLPDGVARLLDKNGPEPKIARAIMIAAAARRDPALKPVLLSLMERSTDYRLPELAKECFSTVGTEGDIPGLLRFTENFRKTHDVSEWPGYTSSEVEDAVLLIRLRSAFAK